MDLGVDGNEGLEASVIIDVRHTFLASILAIRKNVYFRLKLPASIRALGGIIEFGLQLPALILAHEGNIDSEIMPCLGWFIYVYLGLTYPNYYIFFGHRVRNMVVL